MSGENIAVLVSITKGEMLLLMLTRLIECSMRNNVCDNQLSFEFYGSELVCLTLSVVLCLFVPRGTMLEENNAFLYRLMKGELYLFVLVRLIDCSTWNNRRLGVF